MKLGYAVLCSLAVVSFSRTAAAQQLSLSRFDAAPAGDDFLGVAAPPIPSEFALRARATVDWAHNPLVLHFLDESTRHSIVRNQVFGNVGVAMEAFKLVTLYADLPIALGQSGPGNIAGLTQPNGARVSDLRFGARLMLLKPSDAFRVSVGGYAFAPISHSTSPSGAYLSDAHWRGRVELIVNGTTDRILWSVTVGPEFRRGQTFVDVRQSTNLRAGAGIAVRVLSDRSLQIGPELTTAINLDRSTERNWNFEGLMGIRYKGCACHGFEAGAGAGPGFTTGVGTPDFRIVAMVGVGTPDCPKAPPPDRDGDGIIDVEDACQFSPGPRTDDPLTNGCPPQPPCPEPAPPAPPPSDRDGDGIIDDEDACPDTPGVRSNDPATNGCPPPPPDRDGDGIADAQDACPDVPGRPDPRPERNGCPEVQIVGNQVIMLDQVQFETGSATITPESERNVLQGVLGALQTLPETKRFRVEGHTDNRGTAALNRRLSQARAQSVVTWLVNHGFDASRFDAKGFGPDRPIAPNTDAAGRAKNRRTEIHILD